MTQSKLMDYCEPPYQGTALTYLADASGDIGIESLYCQIEDKDPKFGTQLEVGQSRCSPSSLDDKVVLIVGRNVRATFVLDALATVSNEIHDHGLAKVPDLLMSVAGLRGLAKLTD